MDATYRHDTIIVAIAIRYTGDYCCKSKISGLLQAFLCMWIFWERCFYIKSCHHNEVMTLMIYLFVIIYVILLYTCILEFFKYPIRHQIVPKQGGHSGKIICTLVCHKSFIYRHKLYSWYFYIWISVWFLKPKIYFTALRLRLLFYNIWIS